MVPMERRVVPVPGIDRRKSERFAISLPALVREGPAFPRKMSVHDLSESGVCFEGGATLDPRRTYPVELLLPNGDRVHAEAKIVWKRTEPYVQTYGAQWSSFSWWERRKLARLLSQHGKPSADAAEVNWWNVAALASLSIGLSAIGVLLYLRQLLLG